MLYIYILYIYIYFDTWKILKKTSAFLEKTPPFFAAKKLRVEPTARNPGKTTAPHELVSPRHPRNGSYLVENEGQQKMMQDESQRNTGVGVHAVVIVTIVRESKLVDFT